MKVVILAGGLGTRLAEETDKIHKPMVKIGNKPIISHIINSYIKFGFKDIIICSGYKKEIIKRIKSLKLKFDIKFIEIEENIIIVSSETLSLPTISIFLTIPAYEWVKRKKKQT